MHFLAVQNSGWVMSTREFSLTAFEYRGSQSKFLQRPNGIETTSRYVKTGTGGSVKLVQCFLQKVSISANKGGKINTQLPGG